MSRFLSRKSGVEVMLAQATPNEHIKAAEKVRYDPLVSPL